VERRHLLKALLAGISLMGMSFPVFSATKTKKAAVSTGATKSTKNAKATKTTDTSKTTRTTKATKASATSKTKTATASKASKSSNGTKTSRTTKTYGAKKSAPTEVASPIHTDTTLGTVRKGSVDIVNTGEKGRDIVYFENGQYQADALFELNLLLRDWRADKIRAIDPKVFDTLYMIQKLTGARRPFEVISGYRSPLTNFSLLLDGEGTGVARNSLHMDGKAVDIRLPGMNIANLNKAAVHLAYGGVGYYPSQGFLHVDTGEVRRWRS